MSHRPKIAIVEDHDGLRESFVEYLSNLDYDITGLCCAEDLDDYLATSQPAILILDIGLPGEDGFQIAKRLRQSHPGMFIVMLTALANERDKIRGYECGADIYLPKPVTPAELSAAIQAACRRLNLNATPSQPLQLNLAKSAVVGNGNTITLNVQEKAILKALAEANELKLPSWRLLEIASEATGIDAEKNYLELQIFRLRKKLLEAGASKPAIKSLWKEGYKLLEAVEIISN